MAARGETTDQSEGPDLSLERDSPWPVCGVDEAGRGPWAGPVSAAAVILDPENVPDGLDDSKRLTAKARARLEGEIQSKALAWSVAFASVEEIDAHNILKATGLAMRRAVEALAPAPVFALVDGAYAFKLPCPVRPVVRGDSLSCSIAAASILAKTARDRLMLEMDALHPGYGFAAHKGYHAQVHVEALRRLGPSPIHRMTWAPLRALMSGPPNPAQADAD
ncbi:MAG: ribonuclease HII [Caulobacteraceae bacterium]|nr:ribonuclease HII [Caulobacteraceae bacterium]